MTDLALVDPAAAIDAAHDPGEFVVVALERGKSWLTEALQHGDLDGMVRMKGWAATLRTATMQKQLGKDAELAATELVRRAERCIGLGIRQGQEAGEIIAHGDNVRTTTARDELGNTKFIKTPVTEFASHSDLAGTGSQPGYYDMTDDVTDEQFDAAIEEAKAEGNLSRANLVRKVKPERTKCKPVDRHEIHHRAPRIDAERIIEQTIATLDGLASGLALIEDVQSLDAEKRLEWLNALSQPLAAINRFKKELSR